MFTKRPVLQEPEHHASHMASPAKEAKKIILGLFKKKNSSSSSNIGSSSNVLSHQTSHQPDGPRKHSADDPYLLPISPPSSSIHAFHPDLEPHANSFFERRHGSDGGDNQRPVGSRKQSKKDVNSQVSMVINEPSVPGYMVNFGDLLGIKDDIANGLWPPLGAAGGGSETWHAPESWGVQPSTTSPSHSQIKSMVATPEDVTSEEMDPSDFDNWDFGKKKLSTVRIFRPDTTYTTVNCVSNITASELSTMLGKKIFKPDISKYHLYILRNDVARPLAPNERPLHILRRCLLQFGYTDQDKLEELSGKDNSFLCRFTFAESGVPRVTETEFLANSIYTDVNLQRRQLPTIPIFLYSRAKDILRLNVSHNQRMDLPLDFVQNCSALKELWMAYNDMDRVPSNIRSIVHLQLLDLRGNRIKDLEKACLENARELKTLVLQCNRIETIPESFASFQYLRALNLSSNNISKVPLALCRITSLEELDLSFNEITEIPDQICQLAMLRKLLLFGNRIGPFLPKSMEELACLRKLDIRQNGILNLEALNDLPALEELLVDYNTNVILNNSFRVLVRASILKCNMTDVNLRGTGNTLTFLDVSSNKLSNLTPGLFEHLKNLETLRMDSNSITSIPSAISALKRLKTLSIANNLLSSLPDEIAQMESLMELDVHSNSLGDLPASIWMCSLSYLNASSNVLETFPDPPESTNLIHVSSSSSLTDEVQPNSKNATALQSKPLPAPPAPLLSMPSNRSFSLPLANALQHLYLADNRLPNDVFYPLSQLGSLLVLNLSHNYIVEIPRGKIPNSNGIAEIYLSGNQLTNLPADDIEPLRNLSVLHVNGNKLTTLPAELGKVNRLGVLDVGCNLLNYNISNWPYDWNCPQEFGSLSHLRILGLMDVTIMENVPEDAMERRIRTSTSILHNMSYGMADTLGDGDDLCIWDLVHPKFQTKEDEVLFGLFDGRDGRSRASRKLTSQLKDRFGGCFKIELEKMEGPDTVVSALRRTFLGLDRELWPSVHEDGQSGGASALVAYIKGTTLYSANVGDTIAVLVKKSDAFQVISQKHIPWNPTEASRIKRSGGFVSENGRLNDELDISRSFGQYHLVPIVNSNPYIETSTLTEDDDFVIMASKSFWDVMSYNTAVDIAKAGKRVYGDLMYASQKLRDIAISYGARDHMVVMLIGVGDLFKKKESEGDYHQPTYKRPKATEGPLDALKYLKPEIEPPQGDVAMVFAYVKNATKLWEEMPIPMAIAMKEVFNVMRRQLRSIGGYEVKNEAEAMMASFSSVPAAMLWCFKVQELLVLADWPQDILDCEDGKTVYHPNNPDQLLYRGLSVRMGIHWGNPVSHRDEVTRRMDYYGQMVNRSARISNLADGGEICVSSDVISMIQHLLADTTLTMSDSPYAEHIREIQKMGFVIIGLGEIKLKGLETPEPLHLIYSQLLAPRYTKDPLKSLAGTPLLGTVPQEQALMLDATSVRALQTISLRLERLVSGAVARHGRASELSLTLFSLVIRDNADQADLIRIAENCISRIENCFSQLYMAKSGDFLSVFESLSKALENDPTYIMRALQTYLSLVGNLDSSLL
ncbi:PH domain leucine-rich repeat-containing protein phosphatase 2 [Podila horticola]|nr:PH domain leucine-rich repeat-containing protein phosphatase 2 [Podila horticola]